MYCEHFGLTHLPFQDSPSAQFYYPALDVEQALVGVSKLLAEPTTQNKRSMIAAVVEPTTMVNRRNSTTAASFDITGLRWHQRRSCSTLPTGLASTGSWFTNRFRSWASAAAVGYRSAGSFSHWR